MFELYSKGKSAFDIANILEEKGITNAHGRKFVPNTIMNMLKNQKYIGVFEYGDYTFEDYYPPIIDKRTFEIVQERIKDNKRSPARMKAREGYILSGKLYCGYCGSLMTGESGTSKTGKTHHYYKCFGKKKGNECKKKNFQKDELENLVVQLTLQHILSSSIVDEITTEVLKYQEEQRNTAELIILRKELAQTETYISNVMKAIKRGIITDSTQEELEKLEEEKKAIQEKITKAEYDEPLHITKEHIEFWFEQFSSYNYEDEGAREYLVKYFINKIILFDDKLIIIYNHNGDNRTELSSTEIEEAFGSDLTQVAAPKSHNPNFLVTARFVALVYGL